MPPRSLFPVELPAVSFDSRSLRLIETSPAAERLFEKRIKEGRLTTAVHLLTPPGQHEDGDEMELDRLREKLAYFANESEQLPWGQTITLGYYPRHGEGAVKEKAEVLVSLRQPKDSKGQATYTILFVRPHTEAKPLPSRPISPEAPNGNDAVVSNTFTHPILGALDGGGCDSSSTASGRSASFSSADKRLKPMMGKDREKLPLSPETAILLSHATARVRADPSKSPHASTASLVDLSPVDSVLSTTTFSSKSSKSTGGTSDQDGFGPREVVEEMHSLFQNSRTTTLNHGVTKWSTPANVAPPVVEEESETPDPAAQLRLPLSVQELTDLVEVSPQILFLTDADGQVQWLNDAWYRYVNLDNRYHLPFDKWMSLFHPDDLAKALEIYLGAMKSGDPFAMEYRIKKSDGTMRWNVCHGRANKDAQGKILGWACSITDVEELVQTRHSALLSQERAKAVLEASQTLLISVDLELKIDFLAGSLNLPDILPIGSQITSLNRHLQDLLHATELTEAAQTIIDGEETEIGLLHEFPGHGGQKYYVRFRLVPCIGDPSIPDTSPDAKAVTGVIIVGVNVTEAIRTETELEKTRLEQVELESREKAKTDFLTNISHEIRTPISQIMGIHELLLGDNDAPLRESHRSLLEQASRSGDALLELIGAVLDVRKVEAGELKLETQPFLLSEVIADARLFSVTAQSKNLTFEEEIGAFYNGTVIGDRLRLRQVLTNALSNAVKFTSEGGIMLRVRQTSESATQLWLEVDVQDSGVGIEESVLPTLFKPFRQANAGTAREFGGTGLGLVIAKKLVELMNGRVELTSEYGRGTTFKIFVPLAKAPLEDPKDAPDAVVSPAASSASASTNGIAGETREPRRAQDVRVLLAEDNKLIREIVTRTLRGMKFHIDAVQDGYECLAQLEKEDYDVILMDGQMPRLDGYEATRSIRQNPAKRNIRIIALTASAISGDRERCIAAGMDSYLAKPVRSHDLQRSIFEQVELLDSLNEIGS
ncbi:hypothetical protein JCM16303_006276 [Sporobolomyces ruberrimus]